MNIIFMGTPEFAVTSLDTLLNSNHKISAVVTVPDKPQGRGLKISESPVKKFALTHNLNILQPAKLKDESFINEIKLLNADLIVVVAFRILPSALFSSTKYGAVNLHASLLPKYRGAAPINWAIINGETETGVTTFFLKEKVDTGNIIFQEKCEININDDAGVIHDRLMEFGANLLVKTADLIELRGEDVTVTHQDESLASPAPKIFKENCRIHWENSAEKVHNFIRGLSPHPGAFTIYNGKMLKIFKTEINAEMIEKTSPGKIDVKNDRIFISAVDGWLEITELQAEGKKRMKTSDFLRGSELQNGHILE